MNCSSKSDETTQAIDKGICGHVIQHLNMDGSATETSKEKSIPLVRFTTLSGDEWTKNIHSTVREWRGWIYTFWGQVSHFLLFRGSAKLATFHTLSYKGCYSPVYSCYPKSSWSDLIYSQALSLMCCFLMTISDQKFCKMVFLWNYHWMFNRVRGRSITKPPSHLEQSVVINEGIQIV